MKKHRQSLAVFEGEDEKGGLKRSFNRILNAGGLTAD